jgi:predicted Ser/Thr protein kinase
MLSSQAPNQPIYKKIDNYVFNFEEVLGQGNFSKVYKGRKEDTSKAMMI